MPTSGRARGWRVHRPHDRPSALPAAGTRAELPGQVHHVSPIAVLTDSTHAIHSWLPAFLHGSTPLSGWHKALDLRKRRERTTRVPS